MPVLLHLGFGENRENWVQITQIVDTDTHKLIQCVKLHILHQMKPYSNLKTI